MKATVNNINRVFSALLDHHADNQRGADFGMFDDDSDLIEAVGRTVEELEAEGEE